MQLVFPTFTRVGLEAYAPNCRSLFRGDAEYNHDLKSENATKGESCFEKSIKGNGGNIEENAHNGGRFRTF